MSHLIKVATIDIILSLHRRGWSQRRIASELDINRETVARYLQRSEAASKPANAPAGSGRAPDSVKTSKCTPRCRHPPGSIKNGQIHPPARTPLRHGQPPLAGPWLRPRSVLTEAPVARASASPGET